MVRCDAARVKILTGEKKLIDATLAVKVLGQRFDIRVVEELGCWDEGGCDGGRKRGGAEVVSSRASSDGGVSAAAVVVGLSETGSEADVYESCQVLLEVEYREGRKELVESFGRNEDKAIGMSGISTHNLGNPGLLGEKRVNVDGDKWEGYVVVGSAGSEGVLELTSGRSLSNTESVGVEVVGTRPCAGAPLNCSIGPAHQVNEVGLCHVVLSGCSKEVLLKKGGGVPKFLRTNKGDLPLLGPGSSGPTHFEDGSNIVGLVAEVGGGASSNICVNNAGCNQLVTTISNSVPNAPSKKHPNRRNFPNLPYKMLRKLPGPFNGVKRSKPRKEGHKESGRRRGEEEDGGSDSIQNSSPEDTQQSTMPAVEASGLGLEIVLPFDMEASRKGTQLNEVGTSGIKHLLEGGGFLNPVSSNNDGGTGTQSNEESSPSREGYEARKLISINEELGVKFLNDANEEVDRMVLMEARDRNEKLGRERSSGYQ
jgi:hypothetical protein